jgi:hypothetical protein
MDAQELVTITVGGRRVIVPERTSTTEIRTIAGLDRGHVLARTTGGMNRVVSGKLDVREGETFVVGRSFTKGSTGMKFALEKTNLSTMRSSKNYWTLVIS